MCYAFMVYRRPLPFSLDTYWRSLGCLSRLCLLLQINDAIFAYQFYTARLPEKAKEAEQARLEVVKGWAALRGWIGTAELPGLVGCLSDTLVQGWSL